MVIYHKTHISLFIENSKKLQCTGDENIVRRRGLNRKERI